MSSTMAIPVAPSGANGISSRGSTTISVAHAPYKVGFPNLADGLSSERDPEAMSTSSTAVKTLKTINRASSTTSIAENSCLFRIHSGS
ncbi:MAG: hypothetical protein ACLP9K_08495 [Nitrososphaerales archaeon]